MRGHFKNKTAGLKKKKNTTKKNPTKHVCPPPHPQDLLHVWTEPKLCIGGAALPRKKTVPCEGVEFWVQIGAEVGAFTAVLLVSLTCYFWKKNKR